MSRRFSRGDARASAPLDQAGLEALAVTYVARYATTRAKLAIYLRRKLKQRGWESEDEAPVEAIVERCSERGYIDDAGFAAARGAALTRRGFGPRRVADALRAAGIDSADAAAVTQAARDEALQAALAFARRRRIGPFSQQPITDVEARRRGYAALLRAGHDAEIARRVAFSDHASSLDEA